MNHSGPLQFHSGDGRKTGDDTDRERPDPDMPRI